MYDPINNPDSDLSTEFENNSSSLSDCDTDTINSFDNETDIWYQDCNDEESDQNLEFKFPRNGSSDGRRDAVTRLLDEPFNNLE